MDRWSSHYTNTVTLFGLMRTKPVSKDSIDYKREVLTSYYVKTISDERSEDLFKRLTWNYHKCLTVFKCLNGFCPSYFSNLFCLNSDQCP